MCMRVKKKTHNNDGDDDDDEDCGSGNSQTISPIDHTQFGKVLI